ncbi:MAG TPA: class I SAM-dependent methyltransferase [Aggregatilineales bacterium]|nr:methyltransferase domain-containing protein [Anaerolineae bacterium]HUN08097.1 class I SAM-dependent methyltransferase [Aggregatilineales bacterium]
MPTPDDRPRICDYEGSQYRTEFWEGKGRDYEDRVERIALRKLLPEKGKRLLEIGAGFGRLTGEYEAFDQVVLVDYSFSQLRYAQEMYGTSGKYIYVAADAYHLPFRPGTFDAATMIRVIHHMSDVPRALGQVRKALVTNGVFVLEYANKRHAKALIRYAMGKQEWNPHTLEPVEFVELNFDYHPVYMRGALQNAGFQMKRSIPVSFFRIDAIKSRVSTDVLANLDGLLQMTGLHYTPSVFTRNVATGVSSNNLTTENLFVSPENGDELVREGDVLRCPRTGTRWAIREGIYDFKAPLDE